MRSSPSAPKPSAIAIRSRIYRAVGAMRDVRNFRGTIQPDSVLIKYLEFEIASNRGRVKGRSETAVQMGNLPPLQFGMGGGPRFWGVGATPRASAPTAMMCRFAVSLTKESSRHALTEYTMVTMR